MSILLALPLPLEESCKEKVNYSKGQKMRWAAGDSLAPSTVWKGTRD